MPKDCKREEYGAPTNRNFIEEEEININELKQVRNKEENIKNEIPCRILSETDTKCRADKFKFKLGMNETESECNLHAVGTLIESALYRILQNRIWSSVDKVMTKRTQHAQL